MQPAMISHKVTRLLGQVIQTNIFLKSTTRPVEVLAFTQRFIYTEDFFCRFQLTLEFLFEPDAPGHLDWMAASSLETWSTKRLARAAGWPRRWPGATLSVVPSPIKSGSKLSNSYLSYSFCRRVSTERLQIDVIHWG